MTRFIPQLLRQRACLGNVLAYDQNTPAAILPGHGTSSFPHPERGAVAVSLAQFPSMNDRFAGQAVLQVLEQQRDISTVRNPVDGLANKCGCLVAKLFREN